MQNDKDKMNNITEEMQSYEKKFQTINKKYEEIELKIIHISQSRDRTLLELEEMKMRNDMLKERLINIHDNYLSCVTILNNQQRYEDEMRGKFEKLTIERNNLKERLIECKRLKEDNEEEIRQLSVTFEIEKKKNVALLRKLETASKTINITQDLRDKINVVLMNNNKSSNDEI